jgi:hypothetical protein
MTDPLFPLSEATRVDVLARLSRIEGQIRGAIISVSTTLAERCAHESLCSDGSIDSDELTKLLALLRASR